MYNRHFHTPELSQCSKGLLFGENAPMLPGSPLLAFDEIGEISPAQGQYGHGLAIAKERTGDFVAGI